MSRPLVARIDTAALAHNLGVARRLAGSARILAVVKANAYGHGLSRVARALRAADGFAVLALDEAEALRAEGLTHPIVMLEGFFHPDELPAMARWRLQPVIHREDQVDALMRARLDHRLDVFVKVDTGMHRLGLHPKRLKETVARLQEAESVGHITLMTHFANADDAMLGIAEPLRVFQEAAEGLKLPICLANSAALMRYPESHGDWVRPGIMLYGASPFADRNGQDIGLLSAMTLESRLIAQRPLRKGEAVGYGGAFVAPKDMRIGIVACGYADGYPRHADTGTPILVEGHRTRTLGRVSMDMLCVDLTPIPNGHVGSLDTLWGNGVPAEEVAASAGTIAYELLTGIAPRVRMEEH